MDNRNLDDIVWTRRSDGYWFNRKYGFQHGYVYKKTHEIPEGFDLHHIDGDKDNNVIENLLCLSHADHRSLHEREKKLISTNKSGYRGVGFKKKTNKWFARIWNEQGREFLGYFLTIEEAHNAYEKRAKEIWGD